MDSLICSPNISAGTRLRIMFPMKPTCQDKLKKRTENVIPNPARRKRCSVLNTLPQTLDCMIANEIKFIKKLIKMIKAKRAKKAFIENIVSSENLVNMYKPSGGRTA